MQHPFPPNYRPLKVYNASAGSGKTYHLVKEYIQLLISDERTPTAFSNVIAMTFTNKAALEMKERIISALDQISSPEFFNRKADHLTAELAQQLAVPDVEVVKRAKEALKLILHQYEDFHVMTIDKFNLRLIKSFGRDLDLPSDFEVVLDETELIEQIVDNLMNQLGTEGNQHLNELILQYARSNVEDGNSWNFKRNLVQFGRVLNSEKNNAIVEQLLVMDLSTDHFRELHARRKSMDNEFLQKAKEVQIALDPCIGTPKDLPGGGNTVRDVQGIIKYDRFPNEKELVKKRLQGNLDANKDGKVIPADLKSAILQLSHYWESNHENYAALQLFLKNFFNMALLQYMAAALKEAKKEDQIIRISEFNTLISELIQNENAPFIYERLGSRFHHFLLDEFQDTSRLQWLNLVPLVHDSIAQNKDNLIVGDPKQSIYRFKNGVAEQFVALPSIYNPEKDPRIQRHSNYFASMGSIVPLENNWRSSPAIVDLNNRFFEAMKNSLPEEAQSYYQTIFQHPKSSVPGRILIESKEEKINAEQLVPTIEDWVKECIAEGFSPGDICILGGTNKVCNAWALGLNELGYKVVSSDSLLINSSLHVQLCIAFLKRRLKPSGENEKKRFAELYFRIKSKSYQEYQQYIKEFKNDDGKAFRFFDDEQFLDDHFGGYRSFFFKHESIYDLLVSFFNLMEYQELGNPYLHHLADIAFEYGLKRGPDLKGFLDEYESKKHKIAVQIPESDDAIQIMTIHKSKGLEFPVVMVPSFDFGLDVKSSFLVDTGDYIVYKQPSRNETIDRLSALYTAEAAQVITDNVNLCYVAMTRPVERLYVRNSFDKNKFGRYFHHALESLEDSVSTEDGCTLDIHQGDRLKKEKESSRPSFAPVDVHDRLWFPHLSLQDKDELNAPDFLNEQMQFGLQFHLMISRISSADMIHSEIVRGIQSGEVSAEFKERLTEKLSELLGLPEYQQLFENASDILSEQTFIVGKDRTLRPDKIILKDDETIILDFKTGLPADKDLKQVRQYRSVMQEMGYPNIRCFLFYTALNELRELG